MHFKFLPRRNGDTCNVRPNSGCQGYAIVAYRKLYAECRLLAALGTEHIDDAAERIRSQMLPHDGGEPIHPSAEVDRFDRDKDTYRSRRDDHGETFSARRIAS